LFEWKKLSSDEKELYLNPKKSVPDHPIYQKNATKSAYEFRTTYNKKHINITYGKRVNQKLDIFIPSNANKKSPVQLYFHGGYWIGRDKFDHSHIAGPAITNNIIHVSVNYDLCPRVTLDIIVKETFECLEWIIQNISKYGGDTHNINLVGHSAGAHLVAMALTKSYSINSFINSAVLISGIYQPQITRDISINDIINISEKTINLTDVYKHSLIHNTNFLVITGDEEPEAWKLLSKNYCKWLKNKGINFEYFNAINLNHFSIVRDLSNQNTSLSKKVLKMCNKL
jgi:arylformamidase